MLDAMRARVPLAIPPLSFMLLSGLACGSKTEHVVRVATAADLREAFEELGPAFEKRSGHRVSFSFGSTGLLSKQLKEGAPFDVFAAANVSYVDDVVSAGACDGATKAEYARGQLAIWFPTRNAVEPARSLADLADARFKRIAIANPDHAPYGVAAKQALERVGVWDKVKDRIVRGENVQATLELAETGDVDAAIVAYSLVLHKSGGSFVLVDQSQHDPIDQALVVCRHGADVEGGRLFASFVASPEGRAIMRDHGFILLGEPSPESRASGAAPASSFSP
jgi:molybdate transport system substrate-binding protein